MHKKKEFKLEFVFKASPTILYNFLISPSGLSQWFAESVVENDGIYTFNWSGSEEQAQLLETAEDEFAKFKWLENDDDTFFEFRISKAEITDDTILIITDFAADYDLADQRMLWENQITELQKRIGG